MHEANTITVTDPANDRIYAILQELHRAYPDAECALHHRNAFELLVATILSAQCTDVRVNKVTPALFARFPTPEAMAAAEITEVETLIHSTGFYHAKAKNIQAAAQRIVAVYGGVVPAEMAELLTLAGVARKTANVVLGVVYGIAVGVVVDTHVKRLANRLVLTAESTPEKIERDLQAITPQAEWINLSHLLIFHGRQVCDARKPLCHICCINYLCPSSTI